MQNSADQAATVLLVDDHPKNLVALRALLIPLRCRTLEATSGTEALSLALTHELSVILLDLRMPGMNGLEVAACLRSVARTRHLPIIFLTAEAADAHDVFSAYDTGAVDFIVKPVDPAILRAKVRTFVDLSAQRQRVARLERQHLEHEVGMLRLACDERYRKMVEGINHVVSWSADPVARRLTFVSHQAEAILQAPLASLSEAGAWQQLVPGEDAEAVATCFARVLADGRDRDVDHRVRRADGKMLWFHTGMSFSRRRDGGERWVHGVSVDITAMEEGRRAQELASRLSEKLLQCLDPGAVMAAFVDLMVPDFADWGIVLSLHPDGVWAPGATACRAPASLPALQDQAELLAAAARRGALDALVRGAPVADGLRECPTGAAFATDLAPRSTLAVPLRARGRLLGLVLLARCRPGDPYEPRHLTYATDLGDRVALAADNGLLYREAQAARKHREELVAVVSHDLRNPLFSIALSAQQIARRSLRADPDAQAAIGHHVQSILRVTQQLNRITADLADFSRANRGTLAIAPAPVAVRLLLRDAHEAVAGYAADHQVAVSLATPGGEDEVHCDRARVTQILTNLMCNAIKFSPPGGTVELDVAARADNVIFAVADRGPGLDADSLRHVFEPYWRAEKQSQQGMGLGLAIAKCLVAAHGGEIWAEAREPSGTVFCFTISRTAVGIVHAAHLPGVRPAGALV